jgi:hypothetical protein
MEYHPSFQIAIIVMLLPACEGAQPFARRLDSGPALGTDEPAIIVGPFGSGDAEKVAESVGRVQRHRSEAAGTAIDVWSRLVDAPPVAALSDACVLQARSTPPND